MHQQQVADGGGLLDRREVRGPGDERQAGVRYPGDQRAGLGGPGDLVLRPDQHQGGHADPAQGAADVERREGLAGGDVAPGIGGADHLHGPFDDGGLRGGEAGVNQRSGAVRAIGSRPLVRTITPRWRNSSAVPNRGEEATSASEATRCGCLSARSAPIAPPIEQPA